MRTFIVSLLLGAAVAAASTPQDKYQGQIEKLAPPFSSFFDGKTLGKIVCSCLGPVGSALVNLTGVVESQANSGVIPGTNTVCSVYRFDADGNVSGVTTCTPWAPLAK